MTIDLLLTVRRALDEKWDKPEVLRLLLLGMLDHVEGMERCAAERTPPSKPPEPSLRIIKEGHIPPRTDGQGSWLSWLLGGRGPDY